ncbi:hypothetical protein IT418_00370 [bacterium]|nr:hypothetical protein [bacterium]
MKHQKQLSGFSLAELLLSMGLFALLVTSVATLSLDAIRASRNSSSKIIAVQRLQELSHALVLNKDTLWSSIVSNTNAGDKSLVFINNTYQLQDGSVNDSGVSVKLTIANASRDLAGNIVSSGGLADLHTRSIIVIASWTDFLGIDNSLSTTLYLSDWNTLKITHTTASEFDQGVYDATVSTNNSGGEVTMETVSYADWCNPSLTMTNHNILNTWFTSVMSASTGNAILGAGSNSNNETFVNLNITHSDPPTLSILGTYSSGHVANDIVKDDSYAYVATDTDNAEVVIVQKTSVPYASVGTFNAPGNTDANAIAISDNIGLVATGSTLYLFDITSKSGTRPQLSSLSLGGTASKIFVRGTYAYITLTGNSSREMVLVNIASPTSPQLTGIVNVSANNGVSVYVNEAGTRAYMVTFAIFNSYNFHVIDVSNKSGTRGSIGQYSTGGMIPIDVVAPEGANRAIIVGLLGSEQYQVVTLNNETNPQYCGGLSISWSVNAISFVEESNGDVYTYVLTADTSKEFRIIKGGIGGGNSEGYGYGETGEYTSPVFDTTSTTSQFYTFETSGLVPANTTMKFQIRSSQVTSMAGSSWHGPDGTATTYFEGTSLFSLPISLSGNRYIQYRAYFTSSDTVSTAYLSSVELTYQK